MTNGLTIVTPPERPCAFCAYLKGEKPYAFVYRDAGVAIMVTREQRGNPHLLVITPRHVETMLEVTDDEAFRLILGVRQAAKAIERAYGSAGISVWQNNGLSAGQAIAHIHFHVAGTLDSGGTEWGEVPELSLDATEKIAAKLQSHLEP